MKDANRLLNQAYHAGALLALLNVVADQLESEVATSKAGSAIRAVAINAGLLETELIEIHQHETEN